MPIVEKLDQYGKGAWIAFAVLGFILFWPLGLATLAFLYWSGRMGCGYAGDRYEHRMNRLQDKMDRMRERMAGREGRGFGGGFGGWGRGPSSGNRAFGALRQAAEALIALLPLGKRPPALMMALHIWAMSHGIAALFGRADGGRRPLPMSAADLLEAGTLIYLQGLGIGPETASPPTG